MASTRRCACIRKAVLLFIFVVILVKIRGEKATKLGAQAPARFAPSVVGLEFLKSVIFADAAAPTERVRKESRLSTDAASANQGCAERWHYFAGQSQRSAGSESSDTGHKQTSLCDFLDYGHSIS